MIIYLCGGFLSASELHPDNTAAFMPPAMQAIHGVVHAALAFDMPKGACDCHVHVMGAPPRYPLDHGRVYAIEELPR